MNNLARFIALLLVGAWLLSACGDSSLKEKNRSLEEELALLREETKLSKGEYNNLLQTLNDIDDTLRNISERQKLIQQLAGSAEMKGDLSQKQQIAARIEALAKANENAQKAAKSLQKQLNDFKTENAKLRDLIKQSAARIEALEVELNAKRQDVDRLNDLVATLEANVKEKSGELAQAYAELRQQNDKLVATNQQLEATISDLQKKKDYIADCAKAYVICGTKRALRQNNILKDLNKQLDKNYRDNVTRLGAPFDFYNNDEISCEGAIISILPERPTDSYRIEGRTLRITDSKKFWNVDKVVVLLRD